MVSSTEAYTSTPLGGRKVILYDLKGRDGRPWNPNATKARAVLNLKKVRCHLSISSSETTAEDSPRASHPLYRPLCVPLSSQRFLTRLFSSTSLRSRRNQKSSGESSRYRHLLALRGYLIIRYPHLRTIPYKVGSSDGQCDILATTLHGPDHLNPFQQGRLGPTHSHPRFDGDFRIPRRSLAFQTFPLPQGHLRGIQPDNTLRSGLDVHDLPRFG